MSKNLSLSHNSSDAVQNIIDDTLKRGKQAIVFVNTKRGAESQAEKIAIKMKTSSKKLQNLSNKVLNALSSPTKQCKRLAFCVKKGSAFHHSGLTSKQRDIVEDAFRKGLIKVICATPTLAMGVDLPAFRVIIRDLKRFGGTWGMVEIPVLEYEQQAGRAGRPGMEDYGEAICIAKTETEKEKIWDRYVKGLPEEIYSKLAVEPVLRTHVLSLIATDFVKGKDSLFDFFDSTFYAQQYADINKLHSILTKIIGQLDEWEFIKKSGGDNDFVSADSLDEESYEATLVGRRISELYLDPYTANFIITCLQNAKSKSVNTKAMSYLHMCASTFEIRPHLRVKTKEYEEIEEKLVEYDGNLLYPEPSSFDESYDEYLNSFKTALFFQNWIDEKDEQYLLEKYGVRPGEIHAKREIADWLLYATTEIARIIGFQRLIKDIRKTRIRLQHGVKEDVLALLKLKNIGRVRARKLFDNKLRTIGDVKKIDITKLVQILGKKTAISVKKQVGQEYDPKKIKVRENKRKGQISLTDYGS